MERSRRRVRGGAPRPEAAPLAPPVPAAQNGDAVASIGHELKTPLSIVFALCSRLRDSGRLDPADAEDVERIRANAYVVLRRIQDMRLVAHLESGQLHLEPALVDVASVVRECVDGFASVVVERGQTLELDAPDHLAAVADEEKLVSVVSNLIANAIRHTPRGGTVRCTLQRTADKVELEVGDSGPGVDPADRERIFQPYRRATDTPGQGLGLAIVREFVALHGGTVTVDRAPEGGALFVVALPVGRRPQNGFGGAPSRRMPVADRQRAVVEELRAELPPR
jgi:signal transduction histidine kinase